MLLSCPPSLWRIGVTTGNIVRKEATVLSVLSLGKPVHPMISIKKNTFLVSIQFITSCWAVNCYSHAGIL